MIKKLIASAPDKEKLEKLINEFYYSNNYIITDDNKVFNKKTNKYMETVCVKNQRKRWRFEFI